MFALQSVEKVAMNSEEINEQWSLVTEKILEYGEVDPSQLSAIFSRLKPQAMSDGFLMLTADNDFLKSWVESHYTDQMKRALFDLRAARYTIAIEVDPNQEARREEQAKQNAPAEKAHQEEQLPSPASEEEKGAAPKAEPAALSRPADDYEQGADRDGLIEEDPLSPTSSLTFENFVIGDSNRMAYSMAVAVAEDPGGQMLNPLFIYGKSGLGKTHLMRAIQNYVCETQPSMKTVYVDSADFLSGYVEATLAHDKDKTSFKNFKSHYQDASILLIDDIQYLQGKEQTLDIVFQIFNHMIDQGKQVVLSADRAPRNITMDERYQSRFNSGGTFDIQPPGVETKLGIIKAFIGEYSAASGKPDFYFPEEIARYIAEISGSNIRELKSAVTKIIYAINAFGVESLSEEKVSQLLENHFSGGATKKLSVSDIQKEVERYYDVSHTDLVGQKRDRKIMHARKVAVYLSREMLDLPYNDIAKQFGGRDHTTIMHSITSLERKMSENNEIREEMENIKRRIKDS